MNNSDKTLSKRQHLKPLKKMLFSFSVFVMIYISGIQSVQSQQIQQLNIYAGDIQLKSEQRQESEKTASELNDLYFNHHPALYVSNNTNEIGAEAFPIVVYANTSDIDKLYRAKKEYASAKMIVISTDGELNQSIDIGRMASFSELKYIVIQCNSNCDERILQKQIKFDSAKKTDVVYYISIPE